MNHPLVPVIISLLAGAATVLQGTLNKPIADKWGLSAAILITSLVFLASALIFLAMTLIKPSWFPGYMHFQTFWSSFQLYYLLPGILGFIIVAGIPLSIRGIGAVGTFIIMIAAQLIVGMVVDHFFLDQPVNLKKLGGAVLAVLSAMLILHK